MMGYGGTPPIGHTGIVEPKDGIAPITDIVPSDRLTNSARDAMKASAWKQGMVRAAEKGIINASYNNVVVREIRPTTDLNFGANANQQWLTTALVSGTRNAVVNSFTVPNNQLIVMYGITVIDPNPVIGEVRLQRGTAGAGGINAIVNLQQLYDLLQTDGFLTKAVMWDPQDIVYIDALPYAGAAGGNQIVFNGYVIEPVGLTLAAQPE